MKRMRHVVLVLVIIGVIPMQSIGEANYYELEAEKVLTHYLDSLTQGDVLSMRRLMGGPLLETRSGLLGNPIYPAFLIETYGQARFSIERTQLINETDVVIDLSVRLDPKEDESRRQYLLRREALDSRASQVGFRVYVETIEDML